MLTAEVTYNHSTDQNPTWYNILDIINVPVRCVGPIGMYNQTLCHSRNSVIHIVILALVITLLTNDHNIKQADMNK